MRLGDAMLLTAVTLFNSPKPFTNCPKSITAVNEFDNFFVSFYERMTQRLVAVICIAHDQGGGRPLRLASEGPEMTRVRVTRPRTESHADLLSELRLLFPRRHNYFANAIAIELERRVPEPLNHMRSQFS